MALGKAPLFSQRLSPERVSDEQSAANASSSWGHEHFGLRLGSLGSVSQGPHLPAASEAVQGHLIGS